MLKLLHLFLVLLIIQRSWQICDRRPQGAFGDPSPVDESFQVLIEGNPTTYIPEQRYNISLSCDASLKFIGFTLVVDSENDTTLSNPDAIGYFELIDTAETRFGSQCQNMIESTNANTKTRINVGWVAPAAGCVLIRAAVLQHRNVWFIDDGFLTKRFCPEEIDEMNKQTPLVKLCCACDEAKYELIMERKWGPNTHPHDFPAERWRTKLSQIIGASHTQDYRFWDYGAPASPGLKEIAEHGATTLLETEIKNGDIRTIIKAPGIMFRKNVVSSTLANVRVDPQHHVISLVSKIEPSPDWILGVAGLELCLENCTWINEKVLNLYPWDIGTDAGPSYMSPDQKQTPADVVRRISSTSPNDQRSPFYEETGAPMKPMATLYIRRKKLYARECETAENIPLECSTHPWNSWSECTTRCGLGTQYRTRAYKDPTLAASFKCQVVLRQMQKCVGEQCGMSEVESDTNRGTCDLTPWSSWSPCSRRCGHGMSTRTRDFTNPYEREKCLNENPIELEQRRNCNGRDCNGKQPLDRNVDDAEGENGVMGFDDLAGNEENIEPNGDRAIDGDDLNFLPQPDLYGRRRQNTAFSGREPVVSDVTNFGPSDFDKAVEYDQIDVIDEVPENVGGLGRERGNIDEGNYGVREEYDENGHKTLMIESSDPNKYDVVQDYCFIKPYLRRSRCDRKILGLRNYWFYDSDDHQCKLFTTDDCDDNKNKFRTLESCEGTCLLPLNNQENLANDNDNNKWSRQFGPAESLIKKPKRRKQQQMQKRKQSQQVTGNIRNYYK